MKNKEKPDPIFLASITLLLFVMIVSSTVLVATAQSSSPATYAYITNGESNTVSVIDTATNTVTATVPVGSEPEGIAVSPDGTGVYVANLKSNTVSVIDTATNTVTATVSVGNNPHGVAVKGTKVYVTNYGDTTVSVIDTTTNSVTTTVSVGSSPFGVAVTGTKAYVTNDKDKTISIIDTTTDTVTATVNIENQFPGGVAVAGTKLYVTSGGTNTVSVIDTATNTVTATVPVGDKPTGVAITGSKVYVANFGSNVVSVIDTATNTVTATVNVGENPYGVAVNPDGTKVYVTNDHSNTVSVIDTSTNTVTATVSVGNLPKAFGQFIASVPVSEVETTTTEQDEDTPSEQREYIPTEKPEDTSTEEENTQVNTVNNYYNNNNTQTNTQTNNVNNYYDESAEKPENRKVEQKEDTQTEQSKASSASVNLQGEKTEVVDGEDILLRLSAVNLITKPTMHVQVIIIPPSGMSISSTEFVESGAGQYTTTYELEPGKGRDIEVRIASNQVGDFNVKGRVIYYFGKDIENAEDYTLDLPIHVDESDPQPTHKDKSVTIPDIPGFGVPGLVLIFMLIFIFRRN